MKYLNLANLYLKLEETSSYLEKTEILSEFLKKLEKPEHIYLLQGKIFPDWDERETGISQQLVIKALGKSAGEEKDKIIKLFKDLGDLGLVAEKIFKRKKQSTLSKSSLDVDKVLVNLQKLPDLQGKGTVERKLSLVIELLNSASSLEAKYLVRTLLNSLRIGIGAGTMRDSIALAFMEKNKENLDKVQHAYDMSTDFAKVLEAARKNRFNLKIGLGKPIKVMLALKADSIKQGFEKVGKPAVFEYKYDGFRMLITKDKDSIQIFTRRLDNVTSQFPDVVKYIKDSVKVKSCILDGEAVGYNKKKQYQPFQAISQRIKRKYEVDRLARELPIELNLFDIVYLNGKSLLDKPFKFRRERLEKIIKEKKWKIVLAKQIITSDEKKAEKFYKAALKEGQEGLMIKKLDARYKPGARVGYMLKLKPADKELDLVITGAEAGTGKRAGWLTSYYVACKSGKEYREVGKVSTGLKEKEEQGLSFKELTKKIKPLITKEHGRRVEIKPKLIVTVVYQNIQRSPKYNSGYALRFPRITALRNDKPISEIATIEDMKNESGRENKWRV